MTGLGLGLLAGLMLAGSLAVMEFWRERNPAEWERLSASLSGELRRIRSRKNANGGREPRVERTAPAPADSVY
jgi:hypothetical protein